MLTRTHIGGDRVLLTTALKERLAIRPEWSPAQRLKISPPNGKIDYDSLSLLSGHTCPFAYTCMAKVHKVTRKIVDGKFSDTRCFSATQEAAYTNVFNQRQHNTNLLQECNTMQEMLDLLDVSIRQSLDPFRIHVGGEFYNQMYFDAWMRFAHENPYRIFYAYTKSLPYWINRIDSIPDNFSLTASYGGRADNLIKEHNLKYALVVGHPDEAEKLGLKIDHDDSLAIYGSDSFALLLHGTQKAGSKRSEDLKRMNRENIAYRYKRRQDR
jgi:hypothetical protein